MVRGITTALALGLFVGACQPTLDQTVSIVTTTRVLAVRAEPAEVSVMPPTASTFTALVAGPKGDEPGASTRWAFCEALKPLAELGPVSAACLKLGNGPDFAPIGSGPEVTGTIPDTACRQFGPVVPMAMMGQPQGRPVDPDPTGGYYQPVQVFASGSDGDSLAIFRSRLACGLAGGSGDQQAAFGLRYHNNTNPEVKSLAPVGGAAFMPHTGGAINPVRPGQKIAFEVSWDSCPLVDSCGDGVCGPDETLAGCMADCKTIQGCTGAERYVNLDLVSQQIVDQRERITVSWFATSGAFDSDTTGRDTNDTATKSDDGWQAPAQVPQQNPVIVWIVLHDDRGGVGWAEYAFDVQ